MKDYIKALSLKLGLTAFDNVSDLLREAAIHTDKTNTIRIREAIKKAGVNSKESLQMLFDNLDE